MAKMRLKNYSRYGYYYGSYAEKCVLSFQKRKKTGLSEFLLIGSRIVRIQNVLLQTSAEPAIQSGNRPPNKVKITVN